MYVLLQRKLNYICDEWRYHKSCEDVAKYFKDVLNVPDRFCDMFIG